MAQQRVAVFGGSGFLGNYVVKRLVEAGYAVNVISRNPERARHLKTCGSVGQVALTQGNILSEQDIEEALRHADIVVNLVGILYQHGNQRFSPIHAKAAENLAKSAKKAGIKTLVHVSALSTEKSSGSHYARSKLKGEQAVLSAFPEAIILRPGIIFGPEDNFFNLFARLMVISPLIFPVIGGGQVRFQPVYVDDVAQAVLAVLKRPSAQGCTMELGGPRVYTFKQLLRYISQVLKRKKYFFTLPFGLAAMGAFFMELLPHPLLTRDQIKLLKVDNVVSEGVETLQTLDITPTPLEAIVPEYLDRFRKR